jgi:hypothetical protein
MVALTVWVEATPVLLFEAVRSDPTIVAARLRCDSIRVA